MVNKWKKIIILAAFRWHGNEQTVAMPLRCATGVHRRCLWCKMNSHSQQCRLMFWCWLPGWLSSVFSCVFVCYHYSFGNSICIKHRPATFRQKQWHYIAASMHKHFVKETKKNERKKMRRWRRVRRDLQTIFYWTILHLTTRNKIACFTFGASCR